VKINSGELFLDVDACGFTEFGSKVESFHSLEKFMTKLEITFMMHAYFVSKMFLFSNHSPREHKQIC